MKPRLHSRSGLTLIEVLIAVGIFALVSINVLLVTKTGSAAARAGVLMSSLQSELDLSLDRVTLSLMAANADEIEAVPQAPLYSDRIDYAIDIGLDDGQVTLGQPERISWEQQTEVDGRLRWTRNPGTEQARAVTWSNSVPTLYEREVGLNGDDDNENGLVDEGGLAFTMEGEDQISVFLTVERVNKDGDRVPANRSIKVTCRN